MKSKRLNKYIDILLERYPMLTPIQKEIESAYSILEECYVNGHKLLVAGNGGSAADAEHIVGELMKSFEKKRPLDTNLKNKLISIDLELGKTLSEKIEVSLPAMTLVDHLSLTTAYMNDKEPLLCFAQQLSGFGKEGDVFFAISTSGNSKNIIYAAIMAKAKGMKVIGLTGEGESKLSELADVCIKVPETRTYMIQELHLPIYHALCLMLEDKFFD